MHSLSIWDLKQVFRVVSLPGPSGSAVAYCLKHSFCISGHIQVFHHGLENSLDYQGVFFLKTGFLQLVAHQNFLENIVKNRFVAVTVSRPGMGSRNL